MAATKEAVQLRISHKGGKVHVDGIEGVKDVELEPEVALQLATALIKHADLAAEMGPADARA
jgi:hypothetical protein